MKTVTQQCPPAVSRPKTVARQPRKRLVIAEIGSRIPAIAAVMEFEAIELTTREQRQSVTAESIRRPTATWD